MFHLLLVATARVNKEKGRHDLDAGQILAPASSRNRVASRCLSSVVCIMVLDESPPPLPWFGDHSGVFWCATSLSLFRPCFSTTVHPTPWYPEIFCPIQASSTDSCSSVPPDCLLRLDYLSPRRRRDRRDKKGRRDNFFNPLKTTSHMQLMSSSFGQCCLGSFHCPRFTSTMSSLIRKLGVLASHDGAVGSPDD